MSCSEMSQEEEGEESEFCIFVEISLRNDIEHGSLFTPSAFLDRL